MLDRQSTWPTTTGVPNGTCNRARAAAAIWSIHSPPAACRSMCSWCGGGHSVENDHSATSPGGGSPAATIRARNAPAMVAGSDAGSPSASNASAVASGRRKERDRQGASAPRGGRPRPDVHLHESDEVLVGHVPAAMGLDDHGPAIMQIHSPTRPVPSRTSAQQRHPTRVLAAPAVDVHAALLAPEVWHCDVWASSCGPSFLAMTGFSVLELAVGGLPLPHGGPDGEWRYRHAVRPDGPSPLDHQVVADFLSYERAHGRRVTVVADERLSPEHVAAPIPAAEPRVFPNAVLHRHLRRRVRIAPCLSRRAGAVAVEILGRGALLAATAVTGRGRDRTCSQEHLG